MAQLHWLGGRVAGPGLQHPRGIWALERRALLALATATAAGCATGPTVLGAPLKASGNRFIKKELQFPVQK